MSKPLPLLLLVLSCKNKGEGEQDPALDAPDGDTAPDSGPPLDTGARDDTIWAEPDTWRREEIATPGSITFTELLYHPTADTGAEWLELHNPMVLDMDLSGWSLQGGVTYTFAEGAVVPAGGYVVVAADPAAVTGAEALGPYDGKLSNGGERIELRSYSGRLIDTVAYGDDHPWPVQADGSGFSLAKTAPTAASDRAENWGVSAERGGTPGASNALDPLALPITEVLVGEGAMWRYDAAGGYPSTDWASPSLDDSGWDSAQAPFFAGAAEEDVLATAWVTADNYFALYLGQADGTDLRLVGEDSDGSWTTVEEIALELTADDHLFLAAWELTGDSTSPQMLIGEVELPDDSMGTSAADFEWVLGPADTNPGALPANAPPAEDALVDLIAESDDDAAWEVPAVEASRSTSPWGSTVSSAFTDVAMFVWGDTFDANASTNSEDTYALFRSIDPVVPPRGNTRLSTVPTTATFRTSFLFEGSTDSSELYLSCTIDDGAVFYLNGVEVHRENLPKGAIDDTVLALEAVDDADFAVTLSGAALAQGDNLLAVELHQASSDDTDLSFGCTLTAKHWTDAPAPTIVFNEVSPAQNAPLWVELHNVSQADQALDGLVLASSEGSSVVLSGDPLAPGELLVEELPFEVAGGDRLFLYTEDGEALLDGVRVHEGLRGRADGGGPWRVPSEATPGEPNVIDQVDAVVINEIQYHRAPRSVEGEPFAERDEEWIELYNRSEEAVDLGGWRLVDGVSYEIPQGTTLAPDAYLVIARDAEALRDAYPGVSVVGDLEGRLSNRSERILLLDALGNPADEVRYYDGGRWPKAADGGGASLELRDPWADNNAAEAWAASEELSRSQWVDVTLRGEAAPSAVGPDGTWEELVLGLLDDGEVLIDDLSVIEDPAGDAVELVPNGSFDDDAHWRLLGNHGRSAVEPDPDDPSNAVLRLVATGPTGHMHNHAETTLLGTISQQEYEISFRARWVSGSNQLLSRLYFHRLPHTTLLPQPEPSGTPGAENSTREENIGPTFQELAQDVAVPAPGEPVLISVSVDDPDGIAEVYLHAAADGAAAEAVPMKERAPGEWAASLDGLPAGSLVHFYVEATDALGATATFPAGGPGARALYTVDDGLADSGGLHSLRILMTEGDTDWLHTDTNLMSNDLVGATVVYRESEVFYDVGVRLKGSQRGRPTDERVGYGIRFNDDQPFRGSHTSVMIDRSEGVGYGQREVLLNLVMTRAGSVSGEHNDLIQLLAPRTAYNGAAELQLDRFSNLVLGAQFADGADGTRFEYELVYYPYTTEDGTDDGLKLPQPDNVTGTAITDLGDDPEDYRWSFLIKNNTRQDRYDEIMDLCKTFALSDDEAYHDQIGDVIDVDQWLRAFAFATLGGVTDQYGSGSAHNAQLYVRPEDGRVLYFPHDLDFFSSSSMAIVSNSDLARLLEDPANLRAFYGHLHDIVDRAYSTDYLQPWCTQLAALLPGQDIDGHCEFIDDRADWVMNSSSESLAARFSPVSFQITTNGGADLTTTKSPVLVEGEGWVDVRTISLNGSALEVTWTDEQTWQVSVPLAEGDNSLTLEATDIQGRVVGRDLVVVTYTPK